METERQENSLKLKQLEKQIQQLQNHNVSFSHYRHLDKYNKNIPEICCDISHHYIISTLFHEIIAVY